ncbi:alpha-L-fucosidase [Catalinimonas alkaloidigena]|uniref:alpha-L-fucosidase n=1 Tax=Catalinimonas alkaloidigena TaxID=1075417 RepID=UPI0024055E8C|nr:alpha-L-fucosidase [Catalinimonas alkaloidigena]MDF9798796.1 alpha-L-fucosidase [Catalinimonas alkaloidigena]
MNKMLLYLILLLIHHTALGQEASKVPLPSPAQLAWQDAELVAVFHYDLHVFDGKIYNQSQNRINPIADHNIFKPEALDTDQWIRAVKDMGAKIAILTATHETGFALYQSDVNPYSLKAVNWKGGKGDIVRDFVSSCRKYGIKPGIYIGIRWNAFYGIHDFKVQGEGEFSKNRQEHYNRICEGMVEELCSRYGDLAIVWFDGGAHGPEQGGPDVLSIFEKYQPNGLFYHNLQRADIRWGGSETGTVPYPCWGTYNAPSWFARRGDDIGFKPLKYGFPDGQYYMPAMSDAPLRGYDGGHEWFWEPDDEKHIYPLENLMEMYYKSVGRNSTLILGLTPDPRGLLPEADVKRLQEWGEEIDRRFSQPIARTSGKGKQLILSLEQPQSINHLIIEEDIAQGERVRKFVVEGKDDDKWLTLYEGSSIGHKHIARFATQKVSEVKLSVEEAVMEPVIQNLAVTYIE